MFSGQQAFLEAYSESGAAAVRSGRQAYWSTKLYFSVREGKQLSKDSSSDANNYYCLLAIDDEVVARTSTVWRSTSNPFFGEEFFIDLRSNFSSIRLYVMSNEKQDPIGKLDFARDVFNENPQVDGWYNLVKAIHPTESHGECNVSLLLSATPTGLEHLSVTIHAARDILDKNSVSKCDPYAVVILDSKRVTTDKLKNTRYPFFDKVLTFERVKMAPSVTIQVCDSSGILGECILDLTGLQKDIMETAWHRLQPSQAALQKSKGNCGSIRLAMKYTHELILPLESYSSLITLTEDGIHGSESLRTGVISVVEELLTDPEFTATNREQAARMLIRIFMHRDTCVQFLNSINGLEIASCRDSAALFRGNSMATKCTDQFMKIVGLPYLHDTIKEVIDRVFHENKNCEIDPAKLGKRQKSEDISKNAEALTGYLDAIFSCIFASVNNCPTDMRRVFRHLQQNARKNTALGGDTAFTVVSGFLFLRFFAPAVLSPKLFGMREELADAQAARTLTLLAKALMSVGNLGSSIDSDKEAYMRPLYPVMKLYLPKLKSFIDSICGVTDKVEVLPMGITANKEAVLIDGEVFVRSVYNDFHVMKKSWKKRYLQLSLQSLTVSKPTDKHEMEDRIHAQHLHVVEMAEASGLDRKFVILIQLGRDEVVLIALPNQKAQSSWLQALRRAQAFQHGFVLNTVQSYNPFPMRKKDSPEECCAKCHGSVAVDQFADNPAAEVWAHKLFAMLLAGKSKLEKKYPMDDLQAMRNVDPLKVATMRSLSTILDDIHLAHLLHQDGDGF